MFGISAVFDTGERIGVEYGGRRAARLIPRGVNTFWQEFGGRSEHLRGEFAFERRLGTAVHGSFELHLPEHHLGVVGIVFVDRNRTVRAVDHRKFAPGMAPLLRSDRTFSKEQNIGGDFCSGIAFEGRVRQSYCAQQVGVFGQMPADGVGLLVHGVATGDERHHAAGSKSLHRLREEVIVDRPRKPGLHCRVVDSVISKRHVADNGVEVIIRERGFLKSLVEYRGIGIELRGDAGRDRIQFHPRAVTPLHGFWHQTEEMAHTHGWLQYLRTTAQPEAVQRVPASLNHQRRRVVRVRCRGTR